VWGSDFSMIQNKNKSLLTYGIDSRINTEKLLKIRFTFSKTITLNTLARLGNKGYSSTFLDDRNYNFIYKNIEPTLNILANKNTNRWLLNYKIEHRNNAINMGGQNAKFNIIGIEYKRAAANNTSLNIKTSYNNIVYNGTINNSLSYIMLDGLLPGKNYLWQVTLDKRLSKGVEMSIDYSGRKSGTNNIIHTGRASVRAIF
jgi:hypothetical protein